MLTNTLTRKNTTVSAGHLPYKAYTSAVAIAEALNGKIGKTDKGGFKATFNSVELAKKFVAQWTAEYEANRKVEPTTKKTEISKKSKATKSTDNFVVVTVDGKEFLVDASALVPTKAKTPSSSKKTVTKKATDKKATPKKSTTSPKGKGKSKVFDFDKIKGKTNADKNKALHKALVGMGMRDSNAPEYKAIWSARPWAN